MEKINALKDEKGVILLGRWTTEELDRILHESSRIKAFCERIDFISGQFLGLPYKESTLIGDINTPEVFVINLEGVDCLTFIEYVESMRSSGSFSEFMNNLKRVRYHLGKVSFKNRNHFFTDWKEYNSSLIEDVTALIGGDRTVSVIKRLNLKRNGTYFLPGIEPVDREISYIPANAPDNLPDYLPDNLIDDSIIDRLRTGDYAGIYSTEDGLDVSHVGIIIKTGDGTYLRHASSSAAHRKVIDEEFKGYIIKKQGLVILRPKPVSSRVSHL